MKSIVSDRNLSLTKHFWMELFKMLGTDLKLPVSFDTQMNRLIERINDLLDMYLRHYLITYQRDWTKLLNGTKKQISHELISINSWEK